MPKPTENKTRLRILDSALSLMMQDGFYGVTVERIITAANISKGSFFYHFASKDDLPKALLERFIAQQGEALHNIMEQVSGIEPPLEKLQALIDGIRPLFAETNATAPGCMMAAFSYQLLQNFPEVGDISHAALDGWEQGLEPFFEPLCALNPAAPPARELALQLMLILQGANVVSRLEKSTHPIDLGVKHFKLYLNLLFSGPQK